VHRRQGRSGRGREGRLRAMMKGESDVVAGLKNKLQVAMAGVIPKEALAEQHRKMAQPGSASQN
jgi:uncharacterized protein